MKANTLIHILHCLFSSKDLDKKEEEFEKEGKHSVAEKGVEEEKGM